MLFVPHGMIIITLGSWHEGCNTIMQFRQAANVHSLCQRKFTNFSPSVCWVLESHKSCDTVACAANMWQHGTWNMAQGTWHMAQGSWHMEHGVSVLIPISHMDPLVRSDKKQIVTGTIPTTGRSCSGDAKPENWGHDPGIVLQFACDILCCSGCHNLGKPGYMPTATRWGTCLAGHSRISHSDNVAFC